MEITIKGRHWKPTPGFREYAVERLERLTRFYPAIIRADLIVTQEGYRHQTELRLHGNALDLLTKATDSEAKASLDQVLTKVERALQKQKDKLKDRKKRGASIRMEPAVETPPRSKAAIEVIRHRPPKRPVLSAEEAARALMKSRKPVLVFAERGEEGLRVAYRLDDGQVGLLELD
jgi:ribosomal subunit interface protein